MAFIVLVQSTVNLIQKHFGYLKKGLDHLLGKIDDWHFLGYFSYNFHFRYLIFFMFGKFQTII